LQRDTTEFKKSY